MVRKPCFSLRSFSPTSRDSVAIVQGSPQRLASSDAASRTNGYRLGLSGPGYAVAERMGLLPALRARERPIEENLHLDRAGREVLRPRCRDFLRGLDRVTLTRSDLAKVLHAAVRDRAEIRFGCTLAGFDDDGRRVDARLSDGTEVTRGAPTLHLEVCSVR